MRAIQSQPNKNQNEARFNPGKEIFRWETYDYEPYDRGPNWYAFMAVLIFGSAYWSYQNTSWGWLSSLCILTLAAIYFWTHRHGPQMHEVAIYTEGIEIANEKFFVWSMFKGYWVLYDQHSSVLHLQQKGKSDRKVSVQLGPLTRDDIIKLMEQTPLTRLTDYQESIMDLWIRALKL